MSRRKLQHRKANYKTPIRIKTKGDYEKDVLRVKGWPSKDRFEFRRGRWVMVPRESLNNYPFSSARQDARGARLYMATVNGFEVMQQRPNNDG